LDEQAMEIRLLADHRHDLVVERTRMQNRLRWHLVTLSPELEASLKRGSLADARQLERVDRQLRRMAISARVRVAREQITQIRSLTRQVNTLKDELAILIKAHRPALLSETGCGPLTAAILIGRTAGAERFATDASFALQAVTAAVVSLSVVARNAVRRGASRS
jgi:transposase